MFEVLVSMVNRWWCIQSELLSLGPGLTQAIHVGKRHGCQLKSGWVRKTWSTICGWTWKKANMIIFESTAHIAQPKLLPAKVGQVWRCRYCCYIWTMQDLQKAQRAALKSFFPCRSHDLLSVVGMMSTSKRKPRFPWQRFLGNLC
jgi:hypothetical protein